jgi:transcriptional regulator with XRE-family HTH domain
VGAIIRPQLADRRAPDARLRFVSHRDVTLDEVDRIDRLLTHAGIVHGRATTGNSLQGMDNPFARRYDGTMTISLDSSRFADELRRWRHIRRWSQLELATRAGTTQRHLSFIERGRSRPGRAIVVRLAESLGLTLRERNRLLLTAGYAAVYPESGFDDPDLQPVHDALRRILDGHLPYPAVVTRPYGEMVAANRAIGIITDGAAAFLTEPPVNVLRLALHPEGMGPRVSNLAEWGRHIVDSLSALALRSPDQRLDTFIAELKSYVPKVDPGPGHLGFAVPLRLQSTDGELHLISTLTSFSTATDVTLAELHLEAFLPADDATVTILQARAANHG